MKKQKIYATEKQQILEIKIGCYALTINKTIKEYTHFSDLLNMLVKLADNEMNKTRRMIEG